MPRKKKSVKKEPEENIWNVPNPTTFIRILLTVVIVYMFLADYDILWIVVVFGVAAFTDFLDGQLARGLNQVTEFGRKFDIRADRILWGTTALTFLFVYFTEGLLGDREILQIMLIMTREIVTLPFVFAGARRKKEIPKARMIGKITTFCQGFSLPVLMLSTSYSYFFGFSMQLALITAFFGIISAIYFIKDLRYSGIKK